MSLADPTRPAATFSADSLCVRCAVTRPTHTEPAANGSKDAVCDTCAQVSS